MGLGICVLAWAGIFSVEWALGAIRIEEVRPDVGALVETLGILTAYSAYEEVMFRVLILCGMIALFKRPWLGVGLSSIMFGLVHLNNPDATALGLVSNALGGVMYGAAFVRTGRVWMPIGLHAAWNWMQGPVFGFNVSGVTEWSELLVRQTAVGPDLTTGGAYVEGSVVVIAFRFVVIALVMLATRQIYLQSIRSTRLPMPHPRPRTSREGRSLGWPGTNLHSRTGYRKPEYELRADDEIVATLRWQGDSLAVAETANGRWSFNRPILPVIVRSVESGAGVATFVSGWTGGGTLETSQGHRFDWSATNFWRSRWEWRGNDGKPLVRFDSRRGLAKVERRALIQGTAADLPELDLLVSLGWYLTVMSARDGTTDAIAATAGAAGSS